MWSKLFIILLLVHYLSASCDICQSGRAACHSENTYSICIDGVPTRNDITCPVGYTCTGEKFICYKKSEGYKPICISGETEPTDSTPKGSTPISSTTNKRNSRVHSTVIYPGHGYKSTTPKGTTTESSTPESSTTESSNPGSTTEDTEFKTFCTSNGDGSYTNENDSACKTFIWCYSGKGIIRKCEKVNSKETWFNGKDKCVLERPEYCK